MPGREIIRAERARLVEQVAETIDHAHRLGIQHRDLKPSNIMLDAALSPKILDFGLSGGDPGRGHLRGTLPYVAPEQLDPSQPIDARADVYAFGILLFEMLTGVRPEGGEAPSELLAGLDPEIDRVFQSCYCRLEKRYPNASAVLEKLEPIAARHARAAVLRPQPIRDVEARDDLDAGDQREARRARLPRSRRGAQG